MKIFLIGMPGSGKSTLGRRLANAMGYSFIDTDEEIVKKEKHTIEEIFKIEGEVYFRETEHNILLSLSSVNDAVVSTGGGMPCFFDNMDIINSLGKSIFINVPAETLHKRLWSDKNNSRPMLAGKSEKEAMEFILTKLTQRLPFYNKAHKTVTGSDILLKELQQAIAELD